MTYIVIKVNLVYCYCNVGGGGKERHDDIIMMLQCHVTGLCTSSKSV